MATNNDAFRPDCNPHADDAVIAKCTWGYGPDVSMIDTRLVPPQYVDLTVDQARYLAAQLLAAAKDAERCEADYIHDMNASSEIDDFDF